MGDVSWLKDIREIGSEIGKHTFESFYGLSGVDLERVSHRKFGTGGRPKLIVGGCSFTYGVGVPYELSWGHRLAELLGVSNYLNISRVGWSIHGFSTRMLSYMQTFGDPEYLAFLTPDLYRSEFLLNSDKNQGDSHKLPHEEKVMIRDSTMNFSPNNKSTSFSKYSKAPHKLSEVLGPEIFAHQSLESLTNLLRYCYKNNIKVAWGTWEVFANELYKFTANLEDFPLDFSTYVDLPSYTYTDKPMVLIEDGCHSELKEAHKECFDFGLDDGVHAGAHHHAHWAEEIYNRIKQ